MSLYGRARCTFGAYRPDPEWQLYGPLTPLARSGAGDPVCGGQPEEAAYSIEIRD